MLGLIGLVRQGLKGAGALLVGIVEIGLLRIGLNGPVILGLNGPVILGLNGPVILGLTGGSTIFGKDTAGIAVSPRGAE
jgi:hypothetical protein